MPRTKENQCPYCGYKIDAASDIADEKNTPKKGDVSICIKCAGLMTFTEDCSLVEMTQEEFHELPDEVKKQLAKLRICILEMRENEFES